MGDGAALEAGAGGEALEVMQPRHAAVLVHDLADHRRGWQAGEAREVDAALGLARAHQHAAALGAQRKDVPGGDEVLWAGTRLHGALYGDGAIVGRDAVGDAVAGIDRYRERRAERRAGVAPP